MKHQIAIFRFTLGPKQSIGPAQLHALWARACQTPHVSVGRSPGAAADRPTYSLYASQQLENLPLVETRLRLLLEECKLRVSLIPLHVVQADLEDAQANVELSALWPMAPKHQAVMAARAERIVAG